MPEAIAPAPPKPPEPPKPDSNGTPKVTRPAGLERTFKDLGRAFNQTGELVADIPTPSIPSERQRGKSIGDFLDDIRDEREKKTPENGKPNDEINPETPNATPAVKETGSAPEAGAEAKAAEAGKETDVEPGGKTVETVSKPPIEDVIRDTVDRAFSKVEERLVKPASPSTTQPGAPDAPDTYEASLGEIEKEELALARFASEKLPDRYKEHPSKLVEFYKKVDAYVTRSRKDDAERTFDDADADFQKFIADNKPRYQATDRRKLERMQITEEVSQKVVEQTRVETETLRANQHKLEVRPVVEKTVQEIRGDLAEKLKDKEDDSEPVKKLRAPIVNLAEDRAVKRMAEYAALQMGAAEFNASKPEHVFLLDFIRHQGAYFAQHGGDARTRVAQDGRKLEFMPMQELRALQRSDPSKAENFWTFGIPDMKKMLVFQADIEVKSALQEETERRTAEGWEPIKSPAPKKEDIKKKTDDQSPPQPTASPKATGSASPGAGNPSPAQHKTHFNNVDFHLIGVKPPAQ